MQLKRLLAYGSLAIGLVVGTSPGQAQSALDTIVENQVVRVGAIEAPPWYHQDLESGKWVGIVPEISELIFGSINVEVEYVPTAWGTAVAGLQADKFDLVGAFNATPERALAIDFTDSIGEGLTGIMTFKDDPSQYEEWTDLNQKSVLVAGVEGSASTRAAQKVMPNASWTLVSSNDSMLLELESGRSDVILTNQGTLLSYKEARNKGTIVYPKPKLGSRTNFGLRKRQSSKELRDWLNIAISYYRANQSIGEIWEKYLPTQ